MFIQQLNKLNIVLGSSSPRREELLSKLGLKFSITTTKKKETYPNNIHYSEIAEFLANQKAEFISKRLNCSYILITADTIVVKKEKLLHKPKDALDARRMLKSLSEDKHEVITGVCIKSENKKITFSSRTEVSFNILSDEEIDFYIKKNKPYDKSGSYGIQEWIGHIGIKKIIGSYNNVIGLPTSELYQKLKLFI